MRSPEVLLGANWHRRGIPSNFVVIYGGIYGVFGGKRYTNRLSWATVAQTLPCPLTGNSLLPCVCRTSGVSGLFHLLIWLKYFEIENGDWSNSGGIPPLVGFCRHTLLNSMTYKLAFVDWTRLDWTGRVDPVQ